MILQKNFTWATANVCSYNYDKNEYKKKVI